MFQLGDRVVCVNTDGLPELFHGQTRHLHLGDIYTLVDIRGEYVTARTSYGTTTQAYAWRFKMVSTIKAGDTLIVVREATNLPKGAEVSAIAVTTGSVKVLNTKGIAQWFDADRFQLKTDGPKIGDTMVVTKEFYPLKPGDTFVITGEKLDYCGQPPCWTYKGVDGCVDPSVHPKTSCKPQEEGTAPMTATPTNKAKKGDTVLVEGVLTRGPDGDNDFAIRFAGKTTDQFVPASAIRQITAVAPVEPTFKQGDKVKMNTNRSYYSDGAKRGEIISSYEGTYFIKWNDGTVNTVKEINLLKA